MQSRNLVNLFLSVACAIALGQSRQEQPSKSTLEGSVVNSVTRQPLKGVSLSLQSEQGTDRSVMTSADGNYTFRVGPKPRRLAG